MYAIVISVALIIAVLSVLYIRYTEEFDETYPYTYVDKANVTMFMGDKMISIYGNNIDLLNINPYSVNITMVYDENKTLKIPRFEVYNLDSMNNLLSTILQKSSIQSLEELREKIDYAKIIISSKNKAIMTIIISD